MPRFFLVAPRLTVNVGLWQHLIPENGCCSFGMQLAFERRLPISTAKRGGFVVNTPLSSIERILFVENQSSSSVERVLFIAERTFSDVERVLFVVERTVSSVERVLFIAKRTVSSRKRVLFTLERILSNVNPSMFFSDAFVLDALYALSAGIYLLGSRKRRHSRSGVMFSL